MHRYFLELSYNGKDFHGWQIQPNAASVQEELESSLSKILGSESSLTGCGRTDTGVHARKYIAHFDHPDTLDNDRLKWRLNSILPHSIAIKKSFEVHIEAHARYSAIERTYRYYINYEKNPFRIGLSWYLYGKRADLGLMNLACEFLIGTQDYSSFERTGSDNENSLCEVRYASWNMKKNGIFFEVRANRFLRNMVRAMVGTLLDVGLGKTSLEEFKTILEAKDRSKAGASAPAEGLFLWKISYPDNIYMK